MIARVSSGNAMGCTMIEIHFASEWRSGFFTAVSSRPTPMPFSLLVSRTRGAGQIVRGRTGECQRTIEQCYFLSYAEKRERVTTRLLVSCPAGEPQLQWMAQMLMVWHHTYAIDQAAIGIGLQLCRVAASAITSVARRLHGDDVPLV